jgi:hypothetical protein
MSLAFDEYGRPFLIIKVRRSDRLLRRLFSLSLARARVGVFMFVPDLISVVF